MNDSATQSVLFPNLFSKPEHASFDQDNSSSDGGAILIKAMDSQLQLSRRLAACIFDERDPDMVEHTVHDLLRRRIIIKAEVVRHPGRDPKNNPRFVVTDLPHKPENVYQIYRDRGDTENRIKELHHGLELDRTSCSSFWANQLRVLMTAAAYVLMQERRRLAAGTSLDKAQVSTLRERLLKLGVWVKVTARRIILHLPSNHGWIKPWRRIALAVGVSPG